MKAHTHAWTAKLHGKTSFAKFHPATHVIGLHFLGATAFNPGGFMGYPRIGEGAAHYARPDQFVRLDRRSGTDIRLGIEAQAHHLEQPPQHAHKGRIEVFPAHPIEAGVTLDALVAFHRGPFACGVNIDRPHGADICAVAACHALIGIDFHSSPPQRT
jgi:hypothetical protein